METSKTANTTKIDQQISVVDGEFTPTEAGDIVYALLNQKINFHKLQRLALWEGNVNANCSFPNKRIEELKMEKVKFQKIVKKAREEGAMLQIKGDLEILLTR